MSRSGLGGGASRRTPRHSQRGWVTSRGGAEESQSRTWCGGVKLGCACGPTNRGGASVRHGGCGGRETPARAAHHATQERRGPDPVRGPTSTTPLGRGSGGGGCGGCGRDPARGPGRTPLLVVVAGRAGTPRHATRGLCGGRGFRAWKGRGPSVAGSTPPRSSPKYPDPGQQGNDVSESQGDRIWSGAEFFPCGFPSHPTTFLNFFLWKDLSVWRIWRGYFDIWRSGWGVGY